MNQSNLEASMKPGKLSHGGFLGAEEKLDEVLKTDDETVTRLGLTHDKIADRIEYFIKVIEKEVCIAGRPKLVDGKYFVGGGSWMGGQPCPWGDTGDSYMMPYSSCDFFVRNQEINEEIRFPGGIVHLIKKHHFYEGKQSPYRVNPEKAARVLNIK